jgi:hypothetical protein
MEDRVMSSSLFSRDPLDEFKLKLERFIEDFHANQLTDIKTAAFKNAYQALSKVHQLTMHNDVFARTTREARHTPPDTLKTGVVLLIIIYLMSKLGAYMNSLRTHPVPSEYIVDTELEVAAATLLILAGIRYRNQSNYDNQHNFHANQAALKIFDEVRGQETMSPRSEEFFNTVYSP